MVLAPGAKTQVIDLHNNAGSKGNTTEVTNSK